MKFDISFDRIKENIVGLFKKWASDKKRVVTCAVCLVLGLVYLILGMVSQSTVSRLYDQLGADRWSEDMSMAQVSIFITQDQMVTEDTMKRFSYELEKKLVDSGVTDPNEEMAVENQGAPKIIDTIGIDQMYGNRNPEATAASDGIKNLYSVAYCAQGQATLEFENRKAENVTAIGAGGDFFLFHPITLVSGTYFGGEDIMKDRIVIDEDLAWQLFGSTDIIGQSVLISGVPHYIVGVVKKETGRINEAAGLSKSYVYMSYDSLSKYGTILSGFSEKKTVSEDGQTALLGGINCVEVLSPNPVKGLAAKFSKESLVVPEESVVVVDNTARFSPTALFLVLKNFISRSMWGKAIFYPYWENVARGYEDILAMILLVRTIAILTVVIVLTIVVINLYRHKKWTARGVLHYLLEKKYDIEVSFNQKKDQKMIKDTEDI